MVKRRSHRDVWHGDVVEWLHSIGVSARSTPTSQYNDDGGTTGSADIQWTFAGYGGGIEVKTGENNNWAFSNWRDEQRAWASDEARVHSLMEYWLAIFIGEGRPHLKLKETSTKNPRKFWLVPYQAVIETEKMLDIFGRKSIPYRAERAKELTVREARLDAHGIWSPFVLNWVGRSAGGQKPWHMPGTHPFWQMYIQPNRRLFWEETNHGQNWQRIAAKYTKVCLQKYSG